MGKKRFLEIRSFNLKPGTRETFLRVFVTQSLPLLRRWEQDVVASGPSPHDETSFYTMRAYESLDHRQRTQDAFYDSDDWRKGPREALLSLIESYTSIVLELDDSVIDALRSESQFPAVQAPAVS